MIRAARKHGFTIAVNIVILAVCCDFQPSQRFCIMAVVITELQYTAVKAQQWQSLSDTDLALHVMAAFNARD